MLKFSCNIFLLLLFNQHILSHEETVNTPAKILILSSDVQFIGERVTKSNSNTPPGSKIYVYFNQAGVKRRSNVKSKQPPERRL
ncbi:MAG: hypothetical protein K9J16_14445 [Melioribacteraceae bacterium]|nr:hypothetical protein [Melioribacteraceae bacterium]MCF8354456.1 hypothetical protein [Melioribacteraceae bacterium]MCF8394066.1 hypothetical protein [Melioribacteraceae bacterium]MCF8419832.1 hypothetical protein [Melioribacteraceae bacterium]